MPVNRAQTSFRDTALTMYQQRWRSKRLLRAYHGDWIPERRFKRWFLPTSLPSLLQKRQSALSSSAAAGQPQREASAEERMPVASLFMRDIERRVDTTLFRACFARSAYEARGLVVQGHVQVNGTKVSAAAIRRRVYAQLPLLQGHTAPLTGAEEWKSRTGWSERAICGGVGGLR